MSTIQSLGFRTTSSTGTTRQPSAGESLAKLLISGVSTTDKILRMNAEEEARLKAEEARKLRESRIARNKLDKEAKDFSTLVSMEAKRDVQDRILTLFKEAETKKGNVTSEQYNEALSGSIESFKGAVGVMSAEDYSNLESFYTKHKIASVEILHKENSVKDKDLVNQYLNPYTFSGGIDELDRILGMQINGTVSREEALKTLSKNTVELVNSGRYKGMKKPEINKDIARITDGIHDDEILNPIKEAIKLIHKETLKTELDGDIRGYLLDKTSKHAKQVMNKQGLTYMELEEKTKKYAEFFAEDLSQNPESIPIAVAMAKENNFDLKRTENAINNFINVSEVNPEKAFEMYTNANIALNNGYAPTTDIKDLVSVRGVANAYDFPLDTEENLAKAALIVKEGGSNKTTMKQFLELPAIKDNFGPDDYVKDKGAQRAIYNIFKTLSPEMGDDNRVEAAKVIYDKQYFGDKDGKGITDWSSVKGAKTKEDVGRVTTYFKTNHNLTEPRIEKLHKGLYSVSGKDSFGDETQVAVYTGEQFNTIIKESKFKEEDQKRKEALDAKNIIKVNKSRFESLDPKYKQSLIMRTIAKQQVQFFADFATESGGNDIYAKMQEIYNDIWKGDSESFDKFTKENPELIDKATKSIEEKGYGASFFDDMSYSEIEKLDRDIRLGKKVDKNKQASAIMDSLYNIINNSSKDKTGMQQIIEKMKTLKEKGELEGLSIILTDNDGFSIIKTSDMSAYEKRSKISYEDFIKKYGSEGVE